MTSWLEKCYLIYKALCFIDPSLIDPKILLILLRVLIRSKKKKLACTVVFVPKLDDKSTTNGDTRAKLVGSKTYISISAVECLLHATANPFNSILHRVSGLIQRI